MQDEYPFDKPFTMEFVGGWRNGRSDDMEQHITNEMNPCDCIGSTIYNNDKNCEHCKEAHELFLHLFPPHFDYV